MALTKETVVDRIEITEDGSIQVRRGTYILEDGVRIEGPRYHRTAYVPGADISAEPARVRAIAQVVWTPAVIAAYQAAAEARRLLP
jgi:hypothetical protein